MLTRMAVIATGIVAIGSVNASEIRALQVLSWGEYADLTDKEKDLYITGLVEGQSFMLHSASHPDLGMFVRCIENVGVTRIRKTMETITVLEPEQLDFPIPWSVALALGDLCTPESGRREVKEGAKTREYRANSIRVIDDSAIMRYQKDYIITVISGVVGSEGIPEIINIGEVIRVEDERLQANIILVTEYKVDMEWGGEILAKKGDISCLIVEREEDIPSDEERDRLWITVKHCEPLR